MYMDDVIASVPDGAALLDAEKPGWEDMIDLSKLRMIYPRCLCVGAGVRLLLLGS